MRIRDDAFLNAQPESTATPQYDYAHALKGVGDPMQRDAVVFEPPPPPPQEWAVGDTAEYVTPDNVRRVGELCRPSGDDWIVKVDDNTYNVVPCSRLRVTARTSVANKREELQNVLASTTNWRETRDPIHLNDTDFTITLDYGTLTRTPSNDAVEAYVHNKYGARVLDADTTYPGKLSVVCTKVADALPEPRRRPAHDDVYPLEGEELEGTGRIGYLVESVKRIAAANAQYDVVIGPVVEDTKSASAAFELRSNDGAKLYLNRDGTITPVLSTNCAPAVGYLQYDGRRLEGALHGTDGLVALSGYGITASGVEAPYSMGAGPMPTHEDEPGAAETGSYVVKADGPTPDPRTLMTPEDVEREKQRYQTDPTEEEKAKERRKMRQQESPPQPWMTAAAEEDGEVREEIAGPGEVTAVDKKTKEIWKKYYRDGYGEMMTRDIPRRKHSWREEIVAAWEANQDRKPTESEQIRMMAVLFSKRTALAALQKDAQLLGGSSTKHSPAQVINALMQKAQEDENVKYQLDRIVTRFVSKSPGRLNKLDPTIYPRLLFMSVQSDPRASKTMEQLYGQKVDRDEDLQPGSPEMFRQKKEPAAPSPEKPQVSREPGAGQQLEVGTPKVKAPFYDKPPEERGFTQQEESWFDKGGAKTASGNRQPAKSDMLQSMCPRIETIKSTGDQGYLCMKVVWNPEPCQMMSAGSIRHQLISFIKGEATKKEHRDLGTLGKPRFKAFDPEIGMAEVWVRSSEARAFPKVFVEGDGENHEADH